jgi:hypothetical protein
MWLTRPSEPMMRQRLLKRLSRDTAHDGLGKKRGRGVKCFIPTEKPCKYRNYCPDKPKCIGQEMFYLIDHQP